MVGMNSNAGFEHIPEENTMKGMNEEELRKIVRFE